jgi:L-malate glycosyltransferase
MQNLSSSAGHVDAGFAVVSPAASAPARRQDGAAEGGRFARPLTIAIVSSQPGWHGGELHAALVARGIRASGHRCVILARGRSRFIECMADEGFEVTAYLGTGRNPVALYQIRRALVRIRPDVLHMNDAHAVTCGGLASMGLGIPVRVAMRHVTGAIRYPARYRVFCNRIICVAQSVAATCRASGIPDRLLRVVPCGADLERVRRGDRASGRTAMGLPEGPQGPIVLLTVAQLSPYKGHDVMLEALPAVLRRQPRVHAVFAGDGGQRAALVSRAREL